MLFFLLLGQALGSRSNILNPLTAQVAELGSGTALTQPASFLDGAPLVGLSARTRNDVASPSSTHTPLFPAMLPSVRATTTGNSANPAANPENSGEPLGFTGIPGEEIPTIPPLSLSVSHDSILDLGSPVLPGMQALSSVSRFLPPAPTSTADALSSSPSRNRPSAVGARVQPRQSFQFRQRGGSLQPQFQPNQGPASGLGASVDSLARLRHLRHAPGDQDVREAVALLARGGQQAEVVAAKSKKIETLVLHALTSFTAQALKEKTSLLDVVATRKEQALSAISRSRQKELEAKLEIAQLQDAIADAETKQRGYIQQAQQLQAERDLQHQPPLSPSVRAATLDDPTFARHMEILSHWIQTANTLLVHAHLQLTAAQQESLQCGKFVVGMQRELERWLTMTQGDLQGRLDAFQTSATNLRQRAVEVGRLRRVAEQRAEEYKLAIQLTQVEWQEDVFTEQKQRLEDGMRSDRSKAEEVEENMAALSHHEAQIQQLLSLLKQREAAAEDLAQAAALQAASEAEAPSSDPSIPAIPSILPHASSSFNPSFSNPANDPASNPAANPNGQQGHPNPFPNQVYPSTNTNQNYYTQNRDPGADRERALVRQAVNGQMSANTRANSAASYALLHPLPVPSQQSPSSTLAALSSLPRLSSALSPLSPLVKIDSPPVTSLRLPEGGRRNSHSSS